MGQPRSFVEIIPSNGAGPGAVSMPVTSGLELFTANSVAGTAPVDNPGAEIRFPDLHPSAKGRHGFKTTVTFSKNKMIAPGHTHNVGGLGFLHVSVAISRRLLRLQEIYRLRTLINQFQIIAAHFPTGPSIFLDRGICICSAMRSKFCDRRAFDFQGLQK